MPGLDYRGQNLGVKRMENRMPFMGVEMVTIASFLRFRDPNHVDWDATKAALAEILGKDSPGGTSKSVMRTYLEQARKYVEKWGAHSAYLAVQRINTGVASWRYDEDDPRNPREFDNPEWNGDPNEY